MKASTTYSILVLLAAVGLAACGNPTTAASEHDALERESDHLHDHGPDREEDGEHDETVSFCSEMQKLHGVATTPAQETDVSETIPAWGTITARSGGEARIVAPYAGTLRLLPRSQPGLGDDVQASQPLLILSPKIEDGGDLEGLRLEIRTAKLELERARREEERALRLLEEGAGSQRRVTDARSAREEAEARLSSAKTRHRRGETISASGSSTVKVRAPISGTITDFEVCSGAFIEEGSTLAQVTDLDRLWLEARVAEADIGALAPGGDAWFSVDGFDDSVSVEGSAQVWTGGVIDPRDRTAPVIYEIPNPGRRLRVGMSADVRLSTGESRRAITIPKGAVLSDGPRRFVFVRVGPESFERRTVRTGLDGPRSVEISSGLIGGEQVVSSGAYAISLAAAVSAPPAHGHAH